MKKKALPVLHNKVSNKELKEKMLTADSNRLNISFYAYFPIPNCLDFRNELYSHLQQLNVLGRVYIATEGINAQISLPAHNETALKQYLFTTIPVDKLQFNVSIDNNTHSFWVLKVKIRPKIVADGIADPNFNMNQKGQYVEAQQLNQWIHQPNTLLVDMRNHYEYEVGHFKNALCVPSDTFREQLPMAVEQLIPHKEKTIVMYCTGGIRCEKASAYLLHKGFKKVYHLKGGIITYAKTVKENNLENNFIGKNFVFDNRLSEPISNEVIAHCHTCGNPCDTHTNCNNNACHLLFIQCPACRTKYQGCCSIECQTIYNLPIEEQKTLRKGKQNGLMIFNKSKKRLRPVVQKII